jgi:2-iminobutanoate/2-iminopropanoate deaminase
MPNTSINPPGIAPPAANYAHAMLTDQPRRMLTTSGVVPVAPDGTVPDDIADQARTVWANIAAMLDEALMSVHDIVSVTTYVLPGESLAAVMQARDEAMKGHTAASTLVTVAELARPAWKMEISVVAAT